MVSKSLHRARLLIPVLGIRGRPDFQEICVFSYLLAGIKWLIENRIKTVFALVESFKQKIMVKNLVTLNL